MSANPILQACCKLLIAVIVLFSLYVQFHGDFGPGGGFQAGIAFAVGIILYTLLFGLEAGHRLVPPTVAQKLAALGVLIYGGVGAVGIMKGGSYLDYDVLAATPHAGQHLGIFLVELGVGLTVASVTVVIFFSFIGYRR